MKSFRFIGDSGARDTATFCLRYASSTVTRYAIFPNGSASLEEMIPLYQVHSVTKLTLLALRYLKYPPRYRLLNCLLIHREDPLNRTKTDFKAIHAIDNPKPILVNT